MEKTRKNLFSLTRKIEKSLAFFEKNKWLDFFWGGLGFVFFLLVRKKFFLKAICKKIYIAMHAALLWESVFFNKIVAKEKHKHAHAKQEELAKAVKACKGHQTNCCKSLQKLKPG